MVTRINGMASGMDVDSMVKGLMDAQRVPLDKLYQKKTYTEWQRDDYRTMNTALSEFDTLIFNGIGMQSSFNKKTVTVSDESAVSVKNVSSTSNFSGKIENVTQLASAATMVSTDKTNISDSSKTLADLGIGDQTITIKAINKDGGFDQVKNADGSTSDKVYTLDIKSTDTLDSVINKINANSGVTVFFDKTSQRFSMIAKNTGDVKTSTSDPAEITLTGSLFTNFMKLSTDNNTAAGITITNSNGSTGKAGSVGLNAKLTYNGLSVEKSSNTFTINGAEITLKTKPANPVTFSSTADVDSIYDTVKKFVDSYNGLIANISDKLSEKKDTNYPPLTAAQKKDMKDSDITLWEAKAKKGTLRNDSSLSSLLTKMRTSISASVDNTSFGNLSKIGISTTNDYTAGGKLEIDETKLRAAIAEDSNGVYNLFNANGLKTVNGKTVTSFSENGVAGRLRADLKSAMTDISTKAGKTSSVNKTFVLGRLLDDYTTKISDFEKRLTTLETRYYKQFTAMEKAVQNANNQSASLSSFLGKGN